MREIENNTYLESAVEWALAHGMAFKHNASEARQVPFTLIPSSISRKDFDTLKSTAKLLATLIINVSKDSHFLNETLAQVATADPFVESLLLMYNKLIKSEHPPRREPLLIMRSDFMQDAKGYSSLVEFNSIAAGMGPFGQRVHELHDYVQSQLSKDCQGKLIENKAIDQLAEGIAKASSKIKCEFNDQGPPVFLMIVQSNEDNVYDQHLLEYALNQKGIKTIRRTFRELYGNLHSGERGRLLLTDVGAIDTVYLRTGYQCQDCWTEDMEEQVACGALADTRIMIERHRVAMNATVSQQLATSTASQMRLSQMTPEELTNFGLSVDDAHQVKAALGDMIPVTAASAQWFTTQSEDDWVLKNQGEGGGHCLFGEQISAKLENLTAEEYPAWALMRRIHPKQRPAIAEVARHGERQLIENLISEIGLFTVHIGDQAGTGDDGYAGYLVRSKPADTVEGGVHTGQGVLDSLAYYAE